MSGKKQRVLVSITRPSSSIDGDSIRIEIHDFNHKLIIRADMELYAFAQVITGLARVPAKGEIWQEEFTKNTPTKQ